MMNKNDDMTEDTGFAELDALLSRPLTTVADNGFTLSVMMEQEKRAARKKLILGGLISLAVFVVSFLLPWDAMTRQVLGYASGSVHSIFTQPMAHQALWISLGVVAVVLYFEKCAVRD